ncbi:MAG: DUF11 domain-containing protein [Anaerolineae bacterium]|nr:DUF11 domain-containing protein [Anaerolineae bacterium]
MVITHVAADSITYPGAVVTYTLVISNVGERGAAGVRLTDTLPAHTAFVYASDEGAGTTSEHGVVVWPPFSLAVGDATTRTAAIRVDWPLPRDVGALTNAATVVDGDANGPDPTPGDNTHRHTVCVRNPPPAWQVYVVQKRDTLFSLAQRYGTTMEAITSYNCLQSTWLGEGQRIYVSPEIALTRPSGLDSPTLRGPPDDTSFTGWSADVVFEWSAARWPLEAAEYYVLVIEHQGGTSLVWTKTPRVDNQRWLSGMGPQIRWQVVIARAQTEDPTEVQEDPTGKEISGYSEMGLFYWHPGSDGPGTEPKPTVDPWRQTPDP